MATNEMNMNRCDIAHETGTQHEYSESKVAATGRYAKNRSKQRKDASCSASEEMFDGVIFFISSALPKCP